MYSKSSTNFLSREETFILIFIKIWNVIDIRGQPSWYIYITSVKITHILYWFVLNLDIEVKASPRDDYFCNMIKHGAIIILSITSVYCNYSCTSSKDIDAIFHYSTNIKSCMKSCITTQAIHLKYLNVNAKDKLPRLLIPIRSMISNYQFWWCHRSFSCFDSDLLGAYIRLTHCQRYVIILKFRLHHQRRTLRTDTTFGNWKPFKNDEKCLSFHVKSSFRSQGL